MKRRTIAGILLITVMAAGTAVGAAGGDSHDHPAGDSARRCPDQGEMLLPPPEAILGRMTCQLSLTAEQQTKIRAILVKENETSTPLLKKLREGRKQLHEAEENAAFDEAAFRNAATRQAQAEVDLAVSRARVRSQVNALLTPEQRSVAPKHHPPMRGGQGPAPLCGDGHGPDHMPPPPCGEPPQHRPDAGCEGGR